MRLWRQFKPFVYLNCRPGDAAHGKSPASRRGFCDGHCSWLSTLLVVLTVLAGLTTLLLARLVTLALRTLLLLARFLAAALLLTGVLALLAGILVLLVRHIGKLPCRTSEVR
jgi:hypothetical protein